MNMKTLFAKLLAYLKFSVGVQALALSDDEKYRLDELRKRSKLGEKLARFETKFIQQCYDLEPEYFEKTERKIFEETKPFGAN